MGFTDLPYGVTHLIPCRPFRDIIRRLLDILQGPFINEKLCRKGFEFESRSRLKFFICYNISTQYSNTITVKYRPKN